MRKRLFSTNNTVRSLILIAAMFLLSKVADAQCGPSAFNQGATLTPTSAWTNTSMGSGTYQAFTVQPNRIYSFDYANAALNPYVWDMTLSNGSSGVINYNNSLTPVRDPWSGGTCPPLARPGSLEWWSGTLNGSVAINTHAYNGSCNAFVAGLNSALLSYKECIPAADPGSGTNVWNVEAFATADIAIPIPDARYGTYVDGNLNFVTTAAWAANSSPSAASNWVGCQVPVDNFAIRARRTGFTCGLYTISDNLHDDNIQIYVNNSLIYNAGCCTAAGVVGNPSGYILSTADNVEIRLVDLCGTGRTDVGINLQSLPAVSGGTIGGVANNSDICEGAPLGSFTNISGAAGGTVGFTNGGNFVYDWELSTDGGGTFNSVGNPNTAWSSPDVVTAGTTYVIRRKVTDKCGNIAYSNTITVTGRPGPNGGLSPTNQTICPGTSTTINVNFTSGTGPFDIGYTDGVTNFGVVGVNDGDAITVTPAATSTYNFYGISDSYGCFRTSGFNSGASVTVIPNIVYNSVIPTDASCNGSGTGTITVNASGGNGGLEYSSDGGNNYQTPSNILGGLVAGSYDVYVKDNFGCVKPYGTPVVIGQPTDITQTLSGTDASCANVFDGTITVTASGGIPPYSYSLNGGPTQPGNTFTVGAGNYVVGVYDANSCVDTASITIGNSYIISVAIDAQANVSCVGAADGSFTVHVNGGVSPYSYSINGVSYQSSGTFTGLSAGTYIVIGRDSKGCTETVNVTIAPPAPIVVSIDSVHNVSCNGTATGAVYISASGGTPGYTYTWSNGFNSEDITGVVAAVYNVTVIDSRGCFSTAGATVSEPLPLFLNVASYNDLLCAGDSSGAIDITSNGGIPPYSYAWSNGANTEDITALKLGTYTATVTDGNGCTETITQVIDEPTPLVASISATDVTCFGASNGSVSLTAVSGGTPAYSFLWSTFQTSQNITGLGGGVYNVIITDHNGCQHSESITVNEPAALILATSVTQTSCFNTNDGAVDLTVTGGTPNYSYLWNTSDITQDISSLGGGVYSVTVTDDNGCTATTSVIIASPTPINTSFVIKNPTCNGDADGAIDLIPSGGTYPYTFNWSNSANTEDLANIPDGSYIITITDARNCIKIDSTKLTEPGLIFTSGFIKNVSCNGANDGFIDITAYGGTLPYYFNWSNGSSTEDIGNVPGGPKTVTVTDAQGCQAVSLYVVSEPAVLNVQAVGTDVACFGSCNGTVAAIPSGGTSPYEYLWSNFIPDSSEAGLCAGKYIVLLTDSNGCHTYDSITLVEPSEISITGVVTDVYCNGFNTGAITITIGGGTPGYTFNWSNGATSQSVTGLLAGTYYVTVTDNRGCIKTASFIVGESNGMHTTVSISNPICFGANNGFISVQVTGGNPPYIYNWNTAPSQLGATATNLSAGVYELTISDINSCSATVSSTVTNPTPIDVTTTSTDSKCSNNTTGSVTATVTGGRPPYLYELNGVAQASNTFDNLAPGTYVIVVKDVNGCQGTKVFTISPQTTLTVDLVAPQILILQGMTTQLTANTNLPVVSYIWSPLADSSGHTIFNFDNCGDPLNCSNPYVTPYFTTVFTVTVMNSDSCFATDTATITVQVQPSEFVPTAFTPNNDNLNDRFEFDILGATNISMDIFDRWGHKVYENKNQPNGINGSNGWDGKVDGKLVPFDTYVWQAKVTYFNGLVKDRSGTVTIMR